MIEFFEDDASNEDDSSSHPSTDPCCGMTGEDVVQDEPTHLDVLSMAHSDDYSFDSSTHLPVEGTTNGAAPISGGLSNITRCDYCDTGQGSCSCGSRGDDIIDTIHVVARITNNAVESDLGHARDFLVNVLGDGVNVSNVFQTESTTSAVPFTLNGTTISLKINSDSRYGKSYVDTNNSSYIYFLGTLELYEDAARGYDEVEGDALTLQELFPPGALISTGIIPSRVDGVVEVDVWRSGEELVGHDTIVIDEVYADDQYFESATSELKILLSSPGKDLLLSNTSFLLDFTKKSLSRFLQNINLVSAEESLMTGGLVDLRTTWSSTAPAAQVPYWGGKLSFEGMGPVEARLVDVYESN